MPRIKFLTPPLLQLPSSCCFQAIFVQNPGVDGVETLHDIHRTLQSMVVFGSRKRW